MTRRLQAMILPMVYARAKRFQMSTITFIYHVLLWMWPSYATQVAHPGTDQFAAVDVTGG